MRPSRINDVMVAVLFVLAFTINAAQGDWEAAMWVAIAALWFAVAVVERWP